MIKFLFERDFSVFDLVCVYGITWLATHSLLFLILVIPAIMVSRRMKRRFDGLTLNTKIERGPKLSKVPVSPYRKFADEVSWNKTMSNKDRHQMLQAFGYLQHRLLVHPESGIQGKISLERVQKWIKELS